MLKNRNVPKTSANTIARSSRIGFTRRRPRSSRGFRGSSTSLSNTSQNRSLGSCNVEVNEPIMHLVELCIHFHLRERRSLLPHREIPTAQLPVISDPVEWKPLLGYSLRGEDRRPRLRHQRQEGRVPAHRLAVRAWLDRVGCGPGSRAE